MPISGIVGVSQGSLFTGLLQSILTEGSVRNLRSGTIVVSNALAERAGKRVGDMLTIRGYEFTIVGVFNSKALSELKDLDGGVIPGIEIFSGYYSVPVLRGRAPPRGVREQSVRGAGSRGRR